MAFSMNNRSQGSGKAKGEKLYPPRLSILLSKSNATRKVKCKDGSEKSVVSFFTSREYLENFLSELDKFELKTGENQKFIRLEFWNDSELPF